MTIIELARQSLLEYLQTGHFLKLNSELKEIQGQKNGVFVCFKQKGQLRGCIGTFQCTTNNTTEEIIVNAVKAGISDPRFQPINAEEVDGLSVTVDILQLPEQVYSIAELDCRKYGVIVQSGGKSGTLLPDLEGVDSIEQQVMIAMQKAGIADGELITLYRYGVERYK